MKVSLTGLLLGLRMSKFDRFMVSELLRHLKELRDRSQISDEEAGKACREFFDLYVVETMEPS